MHQYSINEMAWANKLCVSLNNHLKCYNETHFINSVSTTNYTYRQLYTNTKGKNVSRYNLVGKTSATRHKLVGKTSVTVHNFVGSPE